jgi:IS30 family transposase
LRWHNRRFWLRRNRTDDGSWLRGYFAMAADQSAMRRRRSAKLYRDPALAAHVVARLKDGWSPEQIAGRLALDGAATAICHETVYRYVYGPAGRAAELYRHLPSQRRRRRVRYARKPRGLHIPDANTIGKRPAEIGERTTFGHWECDMVAFRQVFGKHNITSLVERRSRYLFISRNPSRHSANIMAGLVRDLGPLPPACRRSITFDRGTEFAGFPSLKQSLGAQSYFCAPSAPWQKGTVENTNGRLRRLARTLMYEAAIVILHRVKRASQLKEWALAIAQRAGHGKARVALARKLSVILHSIWRSGEPVRWSAGLAAS